MQYRGAVVMLDVKTRLPYQLRDEIAANIRKQVGVRDATFSQYVNRMMIVSYDPLAISALTIRNSVQEHLDTDGPATCLVNL